MNLPQPIQDAGARANGAQTPVRVSYIIPTRNRAPFLKETLDNVREFLTPEDEVIVIDGASTDSTADVAHQYRDTITLFRSEPDCCEAHGLNKGILESRGRYIKFLSDDDYIYADAMARAISVLERKPELEALVCGGESWSVAPDGRQTLRLCLHLPPKEDVTDSLRAMKYISCHLGLIFCRSIIPRVGLLDTTFRAIDSEYMSRFTDCGVHIRYLNIKLYRHMDYPHSGMRKMDERRRDAIRIYFRTRSWSQLARYSWPFVVEVFGLDPTTAETQLMRMMCCGDQLRQGRFRRLLKLTGAAMAGMCRVDRVVERLIPSNSNGDRTQKVVVGEPFWDGSLR